MKMTPHQLHRAILISIGIMVIGLYCIIVTKSTESFSILPISSQQVVVSNDVDSLPATWVETVEDDIGDTPSCGNVELRPKIGDSPVGFYPMNSYGTSVKNCNIGESLTLTNRLTDNVDLNQMVSCRITPKRSFTWDSKQLRNGGCKFPPYLYSGSYNCTSAKQPSLPISSYCE